MLKREENIAFGRYLLLFFSCLACLIITFILIAKDKYIYAAFIYLIGTFIWNTFEKMRPPLFGWWSFKSKPWFIYFLWPAYAIYFYFNFKRKLNDPERFWVTYSYGYNEDQNIAKYGSFKDAIKFALSKARELKEVVFIYDQAVFKWRKKEIFEGSGGEWKLLDFYVEPSGEIKLTEKIYNIFK